MNLPSAYFFMYATSLILFYATFYRDFTQAAFLHPFRSDALRIPARIRRFFFLTRAYVNAAARQPFPVNISLTLNVGSS